MALLEDDSQKKLEHSLMTHIPKAVHLLLNDPLTVEQCPTDPSIIIQSAAHYLTKNNPEVQSLMQDFNAKHGCPYNVEDFGKQAQGAPQQGLMTQFTKTRLEASTELKTKPPIEPEPSTPKGSAKLK